MAALLAGGPEASKRCHDFPSQSHVSPVDTPSLVPSACGTVWEPPNRITPRFWGSYKSTAPARGPGPAGDWVSVVLGRRDGEERAAVLPAVLVGVSNAPLLTIAVIAMTVKAPSPKPTSSKCRRLTVSCNGAARPALRLLTPSSCRPGMPGKGGTPPAYGCRRSWCSPAKC